MISKKLGLVLVILGFVLLAATGIRTISSPDIFTHIALGQAGDVKSDPLSYTMAGEKWINMHPLYNGLVYGLWKTGGAPLVTLVHIVAVLAGFILMFRFGKEWGGPLSQALALLLCSWLMLPVFNPDPSAFFILFTAIFVTLLYRVKNFNLLAVPILILQILWTNMHPSFLFGPLLVLFFAIENWQETRNASRTSMVTPLTTKLFGLAIASLAVTLINPNLINLHTHILKNWMLLTGTEELEWVSLFSSGFPQGFISSLTIFTLILGAGGLITLQKKLPAMITMMALVGAFLTVRSIGSLHLFAFLAFPFMILSFNAVSDYITRTLTMVIKVKESMLDGIATVVVIVLLVFSVGSLVTNNAYAGLGSASRFGLGVQEDAFPVAAAGILARDDFPDHIMNISHDGGYIALQDPNRKIFSDTRTTFYGTDFYSTLNRALLGQPGAWKTILTEWNPHAVVLNGCWPDAGALANRLIASRAWKMVYFDGSTIIMVRDLPEYESLINDPAIQEYGVKVLEDARREFLAESEGLFNAGNPSRLIGAGSVYLALNRPKEAEAIFAPLVKYNPDMASGWLGYGQSLILQKKLTKGLSYLERAAKITPRSARVWMSLLQAYRLKGDETMARHAAEQLNKFFEAEEATVEQQEARENKKKELKPQQQQEVELDMPAELK